MKKSNTKLITISFTPNGTEYDYLCDRPRIRKGSIVKVYSFIEGNTKQVKVLNVRPITECKPGISYKKVK